MTPVCVLFPQPVLCFQQLSIESQGAGSKTHTYTHRKLPPGFTWHYFHLQSDANMKHILWEDLWEFTTPNTYTSVALSSTWVVFWWHMHGMPLVVMSVGWAEFPYQTLCQTNRSEWKIRNNGPLSARLRLFTSNLPNFAVKLLTRCGVLNWRNSWGTNCIRQYKILTRT